MLEGLEVGEGFRIDAAQAGLIAGDKVERSRIVREGAEGKGDADAFVGAGEFAVDGGALAVDFGVEEGGLDGPEYTEIENGLSSNPGSQISESSKSGQFRPKTSRRLSGL